MPQIIEHHVTVEHFRIALQAFFGKTIIVIPRAHFLYHRIYIRIARQPSGILIIPDHLAYISLAESQHHVKLMIGTDIPTDIKSASQVIQCHRADTSHEDTIKHTFELLEYFAVKATGMGQGMINFVALLVQHHVSEIIVFIHYQIKLGSVITCLTLQKVNFVGSAALGFHFLFEARIIIGFIDRSKIIQSATAVIIKALGKCSIKPSHSGKIKIKYLESPLQLCRTTTYPQIAEAFFELFFLRDVIISSEHTQKDALAKTPGPDEKQITGLLFQHRQIHRLIHIILVLLHHFHKIGNPIRDSFYFFHNCSFL